MPLGLRVAVLASVGLGAALPFNVHHAWARSLNDPPAAVNDWDEHVMSAAGPWRRGWDDDWDGRAPPKGRDDPQRAQSGKVRHLLLIRHGQYDLSSAAKGITALGERQAQLTGARLAALAAGVRSDHYGERRVKYQRIVSSTKLRARQTADIISAALPGVPRDPDDPLLKEGLPCIPVPGDKAKFLEEDPPSKILTQAPRLEAAFRSYFYRSVDHKRQVKNKETPKEPGKEPPKEAKPDVEHEYTIIICHMNITRYFVCRALQLPPEAWLRLTGDNCSITEVAIFPNGSVKLVRFADSGHLPMEMQTFH